MVLRDPKKVPHRLRREVMRVSQKSAQHREAFQALQEAKDVEDVAKLLPPEFLDLADELATAAALALIESWSFGDLTAETLENLPGDAYDAINSLVMPHLDALFPDFGVSPDPKALTANSNG